MSAAVLREALLRVRGGARLGLATLVATRGSTPQKVGARLVMHGPERIAGTLGGGAVEAEAMREATLAAESGTAGLREYALANGTDDWGLACGGTMVVFVEPVDARAVPWLSAVTAAAAGGDAVALVTEIDGPAAGARLLVRDRGTEGELRDAALTAEAVLAGQRVLAHEGTDLVTAGETRLFVEAFGPPPAVVIVGAGHVGRALAGLARFLGLHVTVVDDRPEYASGERFPEADRVIAAPVGSAVAELAPGAGTAVIVAMRNQDLDYEATAAALRTPARYVGLIGARRKAILITERLIEAGVAPERARALRAPIGLDIGARTPEEIALSILGEWIMTRQGGSGTPLRLADDLFAKAARPKTISGAAAPPA